MILFSNRDVGEAKTAQLNAMRLELEKYERDYILGVDVEELVNHLWQKYRFEAPVIHFDKRTIIEDGESGRGVYVRVAFPYNGSKEALEMRPTTYQGGCLEGNITDKDIRVTYTGSDSAAILATMQREQKATELSLRFIDQSLRLFDNELQAQARLGIEQRRTKLQRQRSIVDGLGIPKMVREETPLTYPAPELRRNPPIARPSLADKHREPSVEFAEYDFILEVISSMAKVMERSPRAFVHMEEEFLRDFFLVHLNGHYKGQATGETFNFGGKTDILVRAENANIFIAECKFWEGPKGYLEAIDQLLGYVTWRDTKTAIILFNRRKNFGAVLQQIPEVTAQHSKYASVEPYNSESGFRFIFRNANDASKHFYLTVIAFDVPSMPED